ncbi:MAG: hypothetical protein CMD03_00560 [Flavobacteriales bacterium]|nr:hypothetical protein [Flavobacteriales bacterium]
MKKSYILECSYDYPFIVLAINSHSKPYKLCWALNKYFGLNFEKTKSHEIKDGLKFTRYKSKKKDNTHLNLLVNQSKKGYLMPSKKSVNYFLIINKKNWKNKKHEFLSKLKKINDILLVFELEEDINSNRFIIND